MSIENKVMAGGNFLRVPPIQFKLGLDAPSVESTKMPGVESDESLMIDRGYDISNNGTAKQLQRSLQKLLLLLHNELF